MTNHKGFLIDLDGTMYLGKDEIAGAKEFVQHLMAQDFPYLFVTNNSSQTPEQVAEKLTTFQIPTTTEQIFTTSMATASYLSKTKPGAKVYAIGETGLHTALQEKGLVFCEEKPDFVVVGIDRKITYEKLAIACLAIRDGAKFIATNGDVAIPTERGFLPGNGAFVSFIATSTGAKPTFIGKPESVIMELALEVLGTKKEETLMVGDNYHTDILAGIHAGVETLLVHTGVTSKETLATYEEQPTFTADSLLDWMKKSK